MTATKYVGDLTIKSEGYQHIVSLKISDKDYVKTFKSNYSRYDMNHTDIKGAVGSCLELFLRDYFITCDYNPDKIIVQLPGTEVMANDMVLFFNRLHIDEHMLIEIPSWFYNTKTLICQQKINKENWIIPPKLVKILNIEELRQTHPELFI